MKLRVSIGTLLVLAVMCSYVRASEPIVLQATSDFEVLSGVEGQAEAYIHKGKQALAIDAAKYKDMYASAQTVFAGPSDYYDITLTALLETDGESSYKLSIDGRTVGDARQNKETKEDYVPYEHTWKGVRVNKNNVITVSFNTHTNGKIPEGNTTAYSRGRWTRLILVPAALDNEVDAER